MPGLGQNFIHAGLINKGDESEPSAGIRGGEGRGGGEEGGGGINDTETDVDM